MTCPAESICIVYPAWYLVAALALVVATLLFIVVLALWDRTR